MAIQMHERLIVGSLMLLAALLAAAPWVSGFNDNPAPLLSATVLAMLFLAAAFVARSHRYAHAASFALAAGAWSMLSPFLWGFWNQPAAFWSHFIAGAAAVLVSVREAELQHRSASDVQSRDRQRPQRVSQTRS